MDSACHSAHLAVSLRPLGKPAEIHHGRWPSTHLPAAALRVVDIVAGAASAPTTYGVPMHAVSVHRRVVPNDERLPWVSAWMCPLSCPSLLRAGSRRVPHRVGNSSRVIRP
jgi:hypothetical protein